MSAKPHGAALRVRQLGRRDYAPVWRAMQAFTDQRQADTDDELWLVEHAPVFTLGQAGKPEHLLAPGPIPVLAVDRGGQVTYHGPGQLVAYPLIDLRRAGLGVRELVCAIEQAVIDTLADYGVTAARRDGAPGVYVGAAKIMALGLRVRRGCSFHGLALNVAMDLAPYARINPCGFAGLAVTELRALAADVSMADVAARLVPRLAQALRLKAQWCDDQPALLPAICEITAPVDTDNTASIR